jgi:hypothetical protein
LNQTAESNCSDELRMNRRRSSLSDGLPEEDSGVALKAGRSECDKGIMTCGHVFCVIKKRGA